MANLGNLRNGIRLCRQLTSQLRASQIDALLTVAIRPGSTQSEIADECGLTFAAVSRFVDVFGSTNRKGRQSNSLGLIEAKRHPDDDRVIQVYLTPKGQQFLQLLEGICYGSQI